MSLLSWNCRGLGRASAINYLRSLLKTNNPQCLFLSETKGNLLKFKSLHKKLGFDFAEIVDAKGTAGGLIFLWKQEIDVSIVWKSFDTFCCTVKNREGKETWRFYNCYGPSRYRDKCIFWETMERTLQTENLPWILIGDLNEIVDNSEKLGGRDIQGKRLFLKDFMQEVGAVDLGFTGRRFTWTNNHTDSSLIKERINRAVTSPSWVQSCQNATIKHLHFEESDHSPILLNTSGFEEDRNRPFRFIQAWTTDQRSVQIVHDAWRDRIYNGLEWFRMRPLKL